MKDSYFKITNKDSKEDSVYIDLTTRSGKITFVCAFVGLCTIAGKLVKPIFKIFNRKKEND